MKKHNFSAGPCILPQQVFKEASSSILNFNNLDLSLIEISHRSADFVAVMEEAIQLVKELLEVPSGYSVLFLQGGASLEFLMVANNLMKVGGKAGYLDTGAWSSKAIKEAKLFGETQILASSKDKNYNYIPKGFNYTFGFGLFSLYFQQHYFWNTNENVSQFGYNYSLRYVFRYF